MQLQIVCKKMPAGYLNGALSFATGCHLAHSAPDDEQAVRKLDYEKELRRQGVGSPARAGSFSAFCRRPEDHPDALEIFRRAVAVDASISLSTVYRTMKLLGDMGAIHRHAFEGGPSRFEHATGDHHDHLIDIETGDVIEFKSDRIEQLQDEIAKSLGYDIVHHRLELYGRKRRAG